MGARERDAMPTALSWVRGTVNSGVAGALIEAQTAMPVNPQLKLAMRVFVIMTSLFPVFDNTVPNLQITPVRVTATLNIRQALTLMPFVADAGTIYTRQLVCLEGTTAALATPSTSGPIETGMPGQVWFPGGLVMATGNLSAYIQADPGIVGASNFRWAMGYNIEEVTTEELLAALSISETF